MSTWLFSMSQNIRKAKSKWNKLTPFQRKIPQWPCLPFVLIRFSYSLFFCAQSACILSIFQLPSSFCCCLSLHPRRQPHQLEAFTSFYLLPAQHTAYIHTLSLTHTHTYRTHKYMQEVEIVFCCVFRFVISFQATKQNEKPLNKILCILCCDWSKHDL